MATAVGKKHIAHKGSGHGCVFPADPSLVTPPAPPAPTPFPYSAQASNAKGCSNYIKVNKKPVLVEGSSMSLDPPANQPAQSGGGSIITHATKNIAVMTMGSICLTSSGKGVCATGDIAAMNVISDQSKVGPQSPLLEAGDFAMAKKSSAAAAAMNKKYKKAYPPPKANQTTAGDPVDLGTGFVVDAAVDLKLPGLVPLSWSRSYSSARPSHRGALGRGGWTHGFEQWIEPTEAGLRLHDEEGLPVDFAAPGEGGVSFHRGERLELRQKGRALEVRSLHDRLTRTFAPLPGGRLALRSIRDPRDHAIQLEYEGDLLVRIVDTAKRELRIANDAKGRVTRVEVWARAPAPDGVSHPDQPLTLQTWFDYAYHPEGELASHLNALGHAAGWEYDGLHRMVKATLRNGISFHHAYDPDLGYCSRTWGDGGLHDVRVEIDFDEGVTTTHGTHRARRYLWKKGIVYREETFDGQWAEERTLDDDDLVVARRNGADEEIVYERDARGNVIGETDAAGNEGAWEYHDDLPVRHVDPIGLTTTRAYDQHGSLVELTLPMGVTFRIDRDREGRVIAIHDRDGLRAGLAYDEHHNVRAETTGRRATTTYRHDALGRIVEQIDALGKRTLVAYDLLGHVTEIVRPDGARVRATFDRLGKLASVIDPLDRVTRFEYAGTGFLARVVHADGQIFRLVYDADERLVRILNPRLEAYEVEYDRADQIVREQMFDGRVVSYRYDRAGRLSRVDKPEGEWREMRYDKLGNVAEDRGSDVQVAFTRDELGRVVKAVCQDVTGRVVTELERDALGRLTADIQNGRAVRYEYDERSRRAARVLPDGERTEYHYEEDDGFAGVTHGGERFSIERDVLGRERCRRGPSFSIELEHDAMDRPLAQRVLGLAGAGARPEPLAERRRGYDAVGRVTSVESLHGGVTLYRYDAVDQLLQASRPAAQEVFEYDPAGSFVNRLTEMGSGEAPWSLARGNLLKATSHARYVNDASGRRIQRIERADGKDPREHPPRGDERFTTYGWDTLDRLREVVRPDGVRVRFTYDAFGRRVRKDVLGPVDVQALLGGQAKPGEKRTVGFLWDGFVLCEEIDAFTMGETPKPPPQASRPETFRKRVHVHEPESFVPMLQIEAGQTFGVVTDAMGVPKELVDRQGRTAFRAEHGAWGDVVRVTRDPRAAVVESPFRLLGQYADEETGLCHTLFRYFEAATARWLSPDPVGVVGGLNLSGWNGAPTLHTDPLGLCAKRLQELANAAYAKLIASAAAVRARLTPDELAAAKNEPWLKRVFFGTALERELDAAVANDPMMQANGVKGQSGSGPDYAGNGGSTYELTSNNPNTVETHANRPNAAQNGMATYPSLPNSRVFGPNPVF